MPSSDAKVIRHQEGQPLPDRPYVSLTEAVTWIVEGDSQDDDYFITREGPAARLNRRRWDSMAGPAWLLPYLGLLCKEQTPEDPEDQKLAAAKRWFGQDWAEPKGRLRGSKDRRNAAERN